MKENSAERENFFGDAISDELEDKDGDQIWDGLHSPGRKKRRHHKKPESEKQPES